MEVIDIADQRLRQLISQLLLELKHPELCLEVANHSVRQEILCGKKFVRPLRREENCIEMGQDASRADSE